MHLKLVDRLFASERKTVSDSGTYQPVSFWQETLSVKPGAPLSEDIACDVAVIGGGFTGLSVAQELKTAHPDLEVALLERAVVGHGASGRNGGFIMPLIGWDLADAARKLGEERARKAYELMYGAVAHVKQTVQEHEIDCDMETTGYLMLATCAARERRLRREMELAHRLGFDHEWIEGAALAGHIRSDAFRSGVFDPHPAIVNPAKLARGLKRVVEGLGVRVFEQTPVEELVDGQPATLRTPHGVVRARFVVLCVNGYGGSMGFMRSRVLPVHTYIILTEPLTEAQLESIGWATNRASLETARNLIHYFRLTADNRIAFGGEDADMYYGGTHWDEDPRMFRDLETRFREYFPPLEGVAFTHRWGGTLGVSLDMFPTFGAGGDHGTIFHASAYSGHGVALSNYAGKVLAPHILKAAGVNVDIDPVDVPFFFGRIPGWVPSGPVGYVGLKAYRLLLRAQDRWQGA